jgi:hypothetical protein
MPQDLIGKRPWILADAELASVGQVFAPAPGSAAKKSCAGRWSPDLALLRCLSLVFIPEG